MLSLENIKIFKTKVLILGSGPAGYTAAIYAARALLSPILITGTQKGGQLTITTDVENYPGFENVIQGPWLMEQMEKQAISCGATIVDDYIKNVEFNNNADNADNKKYCEEKRDDKSTLCYPFIAYGTAAIYYGTTLIICTGAEAKWVGLPSEMKFRGYGVSGCATCDAMFYREKRVLVIGGGNTAVEEALHLSKYASKVSLIHRRDSLRADKTLQNRLFQNPKIEVIWNSILDEVLGVDKPLGVTGAKIRNQITNIVTEFEVDGIFIAIGHKPNTTIFKQSLSIDVDEEGYIITKPDSTATSIPGVFAAGDVQDKIFRQAITAAGTGCMAALEAEKFLVSL